MSHLKRFRSWLGYCFSACQAFAQRVSANRKQVRKEAVAKPIPPPVTKAEESQLVESVPANSASESSNQNELLSVIEAIKAEAFKDSTPAQPVASKPVVRDVPRPVSQTAPASPPPAAKVPEKKVAPPPPPVAAPPPPKPQAPPPVAEVHSKSTSTNGNGAAPNGKYSPGAINEQTAQRLARLLISEIKLYYQSKMEGVEIQQVDNIYDLLKEPIDKSRQHYRNRMGKAALETMPDYFHGELVRSLCEGDASRLGPNYQA